MALVRPAASGAAEPVAQELGVAAELVAVVQVEPEPELLVVERRVDYRRYAAERQLRLEGLVLMGAFYFLHLLT